MSGDPLAPARGIAVALTATMLGVGLALTLTCAPFTPAHWWAMGLVTVGGGLLARLVNGAHRTRPPQTSHASATRRDLP